jgi:threonine/homoserine/homoserine lactone efflux protein
MGVKSILAKSSKVDIQERKELKDLTRFQAIKIGFLTNVMNPKATLFFLGLFTFVIKPETPAYVVTIIAAIMILTAVTWFALVALFFTQKRIQHAFFRFEGVINKVFGGLLILLGIKIALANR